MCWKIQNELPISFIFFKFSFKCEHKKFSIKSLFYLYSFLYSFQLIWLSASFSFSLYLSVCLMLSHSHFSLVRSLSICLFHFVRIPFFFLPGCLLSISLAISFCLCGWHHISHLILSSFDSFTTPFHFLSGFFSLFVIILLHSLFSLVISHYLSFYRKMASPLFSVSLFPSLCLFLPLSLCSSLCFSLRESYLILLFF